MILGSDVDIGDLIKLVSGEEVTGIVVGYRTTITDLIIGDRITYSAIVGGCEIHLIRESFEVIAKLCSTKTLNPKKMTQSKYQKPKISKIKQKH